MRKKSGRCVKDRRDCLCSHSSNPKNGIEYEECNLFKHGLWSHHMCDVACLSVP